MTPSSVENDGGKYMIDLLVLSAQLNPENGLL